MKKLIYIFSLISVCSCQNSKTISRGEIDNFVKKYQAEEFPEFKNVSIVIRQRTLTSTIYVLDKQGENLPVYFITYNEWLNKITEINSSLLKEQKVSDYFTKSQITVLINRFRQLNFCLLSIDNQDNVFINPFYPSSPPCLIRLGKTSRVEMLKVSGDFKPYKDNWYINQSIANAIAHPPGSK